MRIFPTVAGSVVIAILRPIAVLFLLVSVITPVYTLAHGQSQETLMQFREKYLGQHVFIHNVSTSGGELLGWQPARREGNRYVVALGYGAFIPAKYAQMQPKVISVQLAPTMSDIVSGKVPSSKNALGEPVNPIDPYVDVIFQFRDGQLAMITDYVSHLDSSDSSIELASVQDARQNYLREMLPKVIGRKIYAVGDSRVFPIDSTLRELTGNGTKLPLDNVPNLEPLRIVEAKYSAKVDRIIMKLRLPDGRFGLVANRYDANRGAGVLSTVAGNFLVKVPEGLTTQEIKAIQKHKIYRGMTYKAVVLSWGTPEKVNDYGSGGKQLIYDAGYQLVYLGASGKVTDWQSLQQ